jgi:glycosyltransferase involved in cell wall biosynthesis
MSRYIHFVSDVLRADGHAVDHLFAADLSPAGGGGKLARFVVPVRTVRAVRRRAAGARYDVVEIHEPIAAAYALARRWDRRLPPLLVTVYALEARARLTRLAYARLKGERPTVRARVAPLSVVWQANLALRLADHVCVETDEDVEFLRHRLGVPAGRISVQHGGVDPVFFGPPAGPRAGVLFVGLWLDRKGVRDLVPAVAAVLDRRPQTPVTLAGCRVPEDQVRAAFPDHVRPRLRVIPEVTADADLAALYGSHAVFAFPSTFEGLPLAVLEAAAAGLGIVTTRTCGMKDFVEDGVNGLLVGVGDTAAFATALDRLVGDPGLAARLGGAAREKARGYTWRRSADQFLAAAAAAARGGVRWRV